MGKRAFKIYFSDFFNVDPEKLENYGAFNISLINDLPLFIDPFLLFNSDNTDYQNLHTNIIDYVKFLKSQSGRKLPDGLVKSWFHFPEVKENWLGYSKSGNNGRGLGTKFANSLKFNLTNVLKNFGEETITGTHLEKLTLVKHGVGKDQISDFTCNLISGYLAEYTQRFALENIAKEKLGKFTIPKAHFNMKTQTWSARQYVLPRFGKEFVLLTPIDMLTKDEAWISHRGLLEDYSSVMASVPNDQIRSQIDNYFVSILPVDASREARDIALEKVIEKFPALLDFYIQYKEKDRTGAQAASAEKLAQANAFFVQQLMHLVELLDEKTAFYATPTTSYEEAMNRVLFLKHIIEAQDGYRLFYVGGKPVRKEQDLQIMFKLTWFASAYDPNAEVNNGRGPADFIVSYGSADKSVIEFKLASNTKLESNMLNQAEIYKDASRSTHPPIKVILYFKDAELSKVNRLIEKHGLKDKRGIVLIDATPKASASTIH
ncbi:hypothetical protein ACPUET_09310 [Paraburkholderia graminis]|uniref:hypothetical protein n=1 Tax=Paraburkholderia graminis TaxID=60548 RepID=UPI003C8F372C